MAGAEGAIIALIGCSAFLMWLANNTEERNKALAATKILNMGAAFLCLVVALYTGSTFMAANAAAQNAMEYLTAFLMVIGLLTILVTGVTWVAGLFIEATKRQKAKADSDD